MRAFIDNHPALSFLGCLALGIGGFAVIGSMIGSRPDVHQAAAAPGMPVAFTSAEGKTGWCVALPGGRPLATPAIDGGKVFLGGGFGSKEFYAFDAHTGKGLWAYRSRDDGPTAAVVADGTVAFSTESCDLEVLTTEGASVWKTRIGDPLMSMPAIHEGKVYLAGPDEGREHQHHLFCFDLKTRKREWSQKIPGEVVTAPVIDGAHVYVTTLEGSLCCLGRADGTLAWSEKKNATSAPTVAAGKLYFSQRETVGRGSQQQQTESIARRELPGGASVAFAATRRHADYLDTAKRQLASALEKQNALSDSTVGFSTAPSTAKLEQAVNNLGQATVAGVWSYQGSRPVLYRGKLYASMGETVQCIDPEKDAQVWSKSFHKNEKSPVLDAAVTPPVLVNGKVFVGTRDGVLVCLAADSGSELWRATLGNPIAFQPAVANGRVYVSTQNGKLFSIETGDSTDHGWLMWGADARHSASAE